MEYHSGGRCAVYREPKGPAGVAVEVWPLVEPAADHVAVDIRYAGLNHLDLWLATGAQRIPPPRVLAADGAGVKAEIAMPRLFFNQLDLLGSTMGTAPEFEAVLAAVGEGMRPVVDSVYPLERVEDALTHLDSSEQFGKVVLQVAA